jgi:NAD(P)-dependent dehydrogenase (short-subunit alcohol dehydrogenase family)
MTGPVGTPRARVAIVTGGTHGIGRSSVEGLAQAGWTVVFQGRDEGTGMALAAQFDGAHYVGGDLCSAETVARLVARAEELGDGRIAGLVNNAGRGLRQSFATATLADWDSVFDLNARAAFAVTRAALPGLTAARGAVVFVSSVAGLGGESELAIYCASKAALIGLAKSLAIELGHAIRFNVVCPGQIATRMMARVLEDATRSEPLLGRIPQRRFGTPEDVGATIVWLLSDAAAFVNGAVLTVDGGETAGLIRVGAPTPPPAPPTTYGAD